MALSGGCACGAIRYRIDGPAYDTGWCHCEMCRKSSGAPAMAFTTCAKRDFAIERGADALGTIRLVPFGERSFCTRCGTSLTLHVDYQQDEIDVSCGSLDDPEATVPEFHVFHDRRISWVKLADGLPVHDGFGIEGRNLEAGSRPE